MTRPWSRRSRRPRACTSRAGTSPGSRRSWPAPGSATRCSWRTIGARCSPARRRARARWPRTWSRSVDRGRRRRTAWPSSPRGSGSCKDWSSTSTSSNGAVSAGSWPSSRARRRCWASGLDEDTCAIVHADQTIQVIGRGAVTIVDGAHVKTDAYRGKGYRPLMVSGAVLHSLPSGYWFDLRARRLLAAEKALTEEREASE